MGMKAPKLSAIATAVIFVLSCFAALLYVWSSFGGSVPLQAKGYRFHVLLSTDAANLSAGTQARISGVRVGRLVKIGRSNGRIDATVELDRRYAPIKSDARVILRSKTLVGEPFVELSPGNPSAKNLPENGTLALANVKEAQGIDQLLGAFDERTRNSLKKFLGDVSSATRKRGNDINSALGNAGPATENLGQVLHVLDQQGLEVQSLLAHAGGTLKAIAQSPDQLRGLVTAGNEVLSTTAQRDRQLTATVQALPGFLRDLRTTLVEVDGAAGDAAPTLAALRPVAPLVRPGIQAARQLVPQIVPLAREFAPVIRSSRAGLPAITKVINASRPLLNIINPVSTGLAPLLSLILPPADLFDAYKHEIVALFANTGAALQAKDATGQHVLRALAPLTNEAVYGAPRRQPSNRHNPYFSPGALNDLATGLKAFDCDNTGNPSSVPVLGSGVPPCVVQAPWKFNGQTRSFPHIDAFK